jgi:hypothetical protein
MHKNNSSVRYVSVQSYPHNRERLLGKKFLREIWICIEFDLNQYDRSVSDVMVGLFNLVRMITKAEHDRAHHFLQMHDGCEGGRYVETIDTHLRRISGLEHKCLRSKRERSFQAVRRHYNAIRPHASLGYKPPAPEVFVPVIPENYIRTDSRGSAESAHDPTRCAWS